MTYSFPEKDSERDEVDADADDADDEDGDALDDELEVVGELLEPVEFRLGRSVGRRQKVLFDEAGVGQTAAAAIAAHHVHLELRPELELCSGKRV